MPVPWDIANKLILYHGTDDQSATNLLRAPPPSLARCQLLTDFGLGFYTTTHLHQAKNWANTRALRLFRQGRRLRAAVIWFEVAWTTLDGLTRLSFVVEGSLTSQYWDLVGTCRGGHFRGPPPYEVVFGPVRALSD